MDDSYVQIRNAFVAQQGIEVLCNAGDTQLLILLGSSLPSVPIVARVISWCLWCEEEQFRMINGNEHKYLHISTFFIEATPLVPRGTPVDIIIY
mmetsp:Transcript_3067/g.7241  ORF Transcript_3067/g.7241 Transcript_3067/m.7241 type:complete len:94 (+) Transcript_3067:1025-1306(+)